jgi:hypothetical protein
MLHMRVSQVPVEFSLHMRAQFLLTLDIPVDATTKRPTPGRQRIPKTDRKHQDLPETLQAIAVVNKECLSQSHANCASRQITCYPCGCGWARLVQLSQDDAGCFR